jgi:hypothetical protein
LQEEEDAKQLVESRPNTPVNIEGEVNFTIDNAVHDFNPR